MDRALDLQTLIDAVGDHVRLPDPADLRQLLADTEISLFTQQADIDEQVIDTGWYLQAVATARPDLGLYDLARQRLAHQVSGHIFDLALQATDLSPLEQLRYTFAAQVGYLGGDLTPNAAALARRAPLPTAPYEWSEPGQMSLEAGILLLALDRPALSPFLSARRAQLDRRRAEVGGLAATPYAAVDGVIRGVAALTNYLTYGRTSQLEQAQQLLAAAMASEPAEPDLDSRWVAAHLLRIGGELATTSVWAVLPPDLSSAARAMTLGDPPVLSLWPPQLDFLGAGEGELSPLDPEVRRLVLSFPTSAGKTLLAQMLITAHVASSATGDVCVVAPTHSLCRELSQSLDRRLRTLGQQIYVEGPLGLELPKPPAAQVAVMTPEKLAAVLRSNPAEVLAQYAMFVIDEAHLVADPSRGWRLEETLSLLHHLTTDTEHRILVLSAALGNESHVTQWMTAADSQPVEHHTTWRGPRRLNAVYSNEPDWDGVVEVPTQGRTLARRHYDLHGVVHLRTGDNTVEGTFTEPVGTMVRRQKKNGEWTRDTDASTLERERLVPLINHVAASGPVLIVQPTRIEAQRLAEDVAATVDDDGAATFALVDLARARLTDAHPLTQMVGKGIAFHHAALPVDIQAEIEDAVRRGQIRILTTTSTLIEGVNLPFKTVIVGRRGYVNAKGEQVELIDAPGLLNAVGRAGRAGRESEGWMILAELSTGYSDDLFDPLQRTGNDLDIRSTLTTEAALAGLAAFETEAREAEDAIFRHYSPAADGFLSFIWFLAHALEELHQSEASIDEILAIIENTLAWHQLDPEDQERLVSAAQQAVDAFDAQPPERRARWARSGTSLPTAQTLDAIAEALYERLHAEPDLELEDLPQLVAFILGADTLQTLLNLGENDRKGFKPYRTAPLDNLVDVDLRALLLDWVGGIEIQDLADRHLANISDDSYRSETLAEFTASVFEHHIPWTLGIVLQWVNHRLEESGSERRLPDVLAAAIHYGVNTTTAIELMLGGIRSRRLANTVAQHAPQPQYNGEDETPSLREWLADQTIAEWRQLFEASPTEVADLLAYARNPGAQVVSSILEGATHDLAITAGDAAIQAATAASLESQAHTPDPAPIEIVTAGGVAGTIRPSDHAEVSLLINMGIPLDVLVGPGTDNPVVSISLAPDPDA